MCENIGASATPFPSESCRSTSPPGVSSFSTTATAATSMTATRTAISRPRRRNGYVRVRSRSLGWGRFAALPAMTGRARLRGGARWRVGEGNRRGESGVVIGRRVGEPPARAHRRRQSAPSTQVVCVEIFGVRASFNTLPRHDSNHAISDTVRYGHDGRPARAPFTTTTTTTTTTRRETVSWCRTCRRRPSCLPHRPAHGIAASRAR